jgi:small-conductance mechanosensitive channel
MFKGMNKNGPFFEPSVQKASRCQLIGLTLMVMAIFFSSSAAGAEKKENPTSIPADNSSYSLESVLTTQRAELEDLRARLRNLQTSQNAIIREIKIHESQNFADGQLLLVSQPRIEKLYYAIINNRSAYKALEKQIDNFRERWLSTFLLFEQVAERIELALQQIDEIRQSELSDSKKQQLAIATQQLIAVLEEKKQLGEQFLETYNKLSDQMNKALEGKKAIGEKLAAQLEHLRKTSLFRRYAPFRALIGKDLSEDLLFFWDRIRSVFRFEIWKILWVQTKRDGFTPWAIFLVMLTGIFALQRRWRIILQGIENRTDGPEWEYCRMGIFLLRRSFLYLGMTLLFGICSYTYFSLLNIGLNRVLFSIFLLLLVTRWGMDYLEHGLQGPTTGLRSFVSLHLKHFFRFLQVSISVFILLIWIAGRVSLLTWMTLNLLSAVSLVWAVVFWRRMEPVLAEGAREGQAAPNRKWITLLKRVTYILIGGTLLLNLTGYSMLAIQWFSSCVRTVALLFWGWISLKIIREWHRAYRTKASAVDGEHLLTITQHLHWSLIKATRAFWLFILVAGFIRVWDLSGFLTSMLGRIWNFTLTTGSLNLSIKGIALAIVIMLITRLVIRIGKALLKDKILDEQSFEPGLKESILTITGYLGWGLAVILALGILGVNTTSLAVVFGALSVGIGFGLQNIFNNFISGLILLFERPIQVGDYIEINGLWAEIKKINVRATVVQTFDNASLIIPNSEFISKQVTNWSFKDKRMRRNIEVGVTYGSDTDLVQNTLRQIVEKTPKALKFPRPDVIFIDHGPSALIFRLRVWVHVDDYWAVPNQIRLEIDRRFRELGIEIAFPQQDVHIRTIPGEYTPTRTVGDSVEASPIQESPEQKTPGAD